ncbi:myosin heavy chain, muscle-like, partial [Pollicipes pollicipes]|uniref:myosin heavy chain, muscle-like n=1 Tax=Pollicipes pollicipes TaxID=41117 RepID=UPI00188542DB
MGLERLSAELDASRKACAIYSNELLRVKAAYEESQRQLDSIRRENKFLSSKNEEAVRRYQAEIGETTARLEEEVRLKTELQAQLDASERARDALSVQLEESRALLERAESRRHQ